MNIYEKTIINNIQNYSIIIILFITVTFYNISLCNNLNASNQNTNINTIENNTTHNNNISNNIKKYKSLIVSTDFVIQRYVFRSKDSNNLIGNGLRVMIGGGYIFKTWLMKISYDIYMGPYDKTRTEQIPVDFNGSGYSMFFYKTLQKDGLRKNSGNFGLTLGISQMHLKGSLVTPKTYIAFDDTQETINNYVININGYSTTLGLFFCKLLPARLKGNDIKSLQTRVEGLLLTAGITIPFETKYKAQYSIIKNDNIIENTQNGPLKGHASFINISILLGI